MLTNSSPNPHFTLSQEELEDAMEDENPKQRLIEMLMETAD